MYIHSNYDKGVIEKTADSIWYEGGRYHVAIRWKKQTCFPNTCNVAYRRLQSDEKNLSRKSEFAEEY